MPPFFYAQKNFEKNFEKIKIKLFSYVSVNNTGILLYTDMKPADYVFELVSSYDKSRTPVI